MTSYGGRRAPNVSQYIANLNQIDDSSPTDNLLGGQDDLSLFATTDFFDFDMNDSLSGLPSTSEFDHAATGRKPSAPSWQDSSKSDFLNSDFQFPDLASFPSITSGPNYVPPTYSLPQVTSPTTISPTSGTPRVGEKRKLNSISGVSSEAGGSLDDGARVAAEEDKRRRNTAASARFRIKKKQREQALEKTAKEMTDKASKLETKVGQLEMENKWLKSLITEKNDVGRSDFQELYEKFIIERNAEAERSRATRNDGVGTDGLESDAEADDE